MKFTQVVEYEIEAASLARADEIWGICGPELSQGSLDDGESIESYLKGGLREADVPLAAGNREFAVIVRGIACAEVTDRPLTAILDDLHDLILGHEDEYPEGAVEALAAAGRALEREQSELATISFSPEAYESAATFFGHLCPRPGGQPQGWSITVVPAEGEPFDAEAVEVTTIEDGPHEGYYALTVAPWDEEAGRGDRSQLRTFELYDDLVRVEVY